MTRPSHLPTALLPSLALGALLALGAAPACGSDAPTDTPDGGELAGEEARRAVLASLSDGVILPMLRDAADAAEALRVAAAAHAATPEDAAALIVARAAWHDAADAWQAVELLQLGPAGAMGAVAGGQDLRDAIYSWPVTNPCRVDQETERASYTDPTELAGAPVNTVGLDALEYLLFREDAGNACSTASSLNASGAWAALGDAEVRARRAAYAEAVAGLVATRTAALRDAWEPTGGDFRGELAGAGLTATYPTAQAALNALSDAMFYVEKETKDMKLAVPMGFKDCPDVCPDRAEAPWSKASARHVRTNLLAFRRLFVGESADGASEALGFEALVRGVGADAVADELLTLLDAAVAAVDAIPGSLEEALTTDLAAVEAAYDATQEFTTLVKTQFLSVLDLELPKRAEGDND